MPVGGGGGVVWQLTVGFGSIVFGGASVLRAGSHRLIAPRGQDRPAERTLFGGELFGGEES